MQTSEALGTNRLRERLAASLSDARSALNDAEQVRNFELGYTDTVNTLDEAVTRISRELAVERIRPARIRELGTMLAQLNNTRRDLQQHRARRQELIEAELSSLRHVDSAENLYAKAPAALARCCGVDEVGLWSIDGSIIRLVNLHCVDDKSRAAAIASDLMPVPLHAGLLETEVMRRRAGVLVLNARSDPRVDQQTQGRFGADAHLTVPIMPEGKVIGFFHGGCYPDNRPVDAYDFELVTQFVRGFEQVLERIVLKARLLSQRDHIHRMLVAGMERSDHLVADEISLGEGAEGATPESRLPPPLPPEARIRSLLTRREMEVLELMAAGRTNSEIASELVVGVGTVKFHVKHILAKLNATNRAQAVARYMRIAIAQRSGA